MKIKEKMVYFSTCKGEKVTDLTSKLEVANSNFRGKYLKNGLNSDIIIKFLDLYSDCSAEWLLRGIGPMIITDKASESNVNTGINTGHIGSENNITPEPVQNQPLCNTCTLLAAKEQVIQAQEITIKTQQKTIEILTK